MSGSIGNICGVHASGGCFGSEGRYFHLFRQKGAKQETVFRASVLFGRNGSGKTTLAAKIAEACDPSNAACDFFDKDGNPIPLSTAEADRVRVFGENYVRDKVLIEEEGLAAIVMLGTQATAKKRIDEIDEELIELGEASTQLETVKEKAETGPDSLAKLEKDAKAAAKGGGWTGRAEKVEGSKPNLSQCKWASILKSETNKPRHELEEEFDELLAKYSKAETLESATMSRIANVDASAYNEAALITILNKELDEPVLTDREKRILALVQSGNQALVERTRSVFADENITHCPMCQQSISPEYREDLEDSIRKVLSKETDKFKESLRQARLIPLAVEFDGRDLLSREVVSDLDKALTHAKERIEACNELIDKRANSLYTPLGVNALGIAESISALNAAISEANVEIDALNEAAKGKGALRAKLNTLNTQIAWIDSRGTMEKYSKIEQSLNEANAKLAVTQAKRDKLKAERGQKEAEMNNASIAADVINGYLANVYFDKERFRLVAEGNRYKVMSYGKPVMPMDISTGERNVLGLCYFFSEGGKNKFRGSEDNDAQLIVLDDPVSSFDMENRVGICSLIHERARHILSTNPESKVLAMSHDIGATMELVHTFDDINEDLKGTQLKVNVCRLELHRDGTSNAHLKKAEYAFLLASAYRYATSDKEDKAESYIIGNVLRRILEGYATFNYGLSMEKIMRDADLGKRLGKCEPTLSHLMYRLALNDESHMQERAKALNPPYNFERYSYAEKKAMAQCTVLTLWLLDKDHVKKQLTLVDEKIDPSDLEANINQWKTRFSQDQN